MYRINTDTSLQTTEARKRRYCVPNAALRAPCGHRARAHDARGTTSAPSTARPTAQMRRAATRMRPRRGTNHLRPPPHGHMPPGTPQPTRHRRHRTSTCEHDLGALGDEGRRAGGAERAQTVQGWCMMCASSGNHLLTGLSGPHKKISRSKVALLASIAGTEHERTMHTERHGRGQTLAPPPKRDALRPQCAPRAGRATSRRPLMPTCTPTSPNPPASHVIGRRPASSSWEGSGSKGGG